MKTTISTFAEFAQYIPAKQISADWEIPATEVIEWLHSDYIAPDWVVPMLIKLYNLDDTLDFVPLGDAIL